MQRCVGRSRAGRVALARVQRGADEWRGIGYCQGVGLSLNMVDSVMVNCSGRMLLVVVQDWAAGSAGTVGPRLVFGGGAVDHRLVEAGVVFEPLAYNSVLRRKCA